MRWVSVLLLFLASFAFPSNGSANDECADLLKPSPGTADTARVQESIRSHEALLRQLMEEYANRLGPYQDPFTLAFTVEQGDRIFRRLLMRGKDRKWVTNPLSVINFNLKKIVTRPKPYNEKLVDWILQDASAFVKDSQAERNDLQSNLLALKFTAEYLRRYQEPAAVVNPDGEKVDQKEKQEDLSDQEQPPDYPELPKDYKPISKDTEKSPSQDKQKQKQFRIAEVDFKTPFFGQRYFSEIVRAAAHPFREATLPITPPAPGKFQVTGREQIVRTYGKRKVDLFLPPLFKPLQPSDPRALITRSETGGYVLELKEDLPEIHIPLTEDKDFVMMPPLREVYTRPVGFAADEWPIAVQAAIFRKFSDKQGEQDPLAVAQAVSDHLSTEYLYSVGPRSETDPIDALKSGAFQCDMAAYAMVGILRDVYRIPSRVVGGFRAKKHHGGKDSKSYLIIPGDAHAWVEVFHQGQWHLYDPTPVKKDRKEKDGEGKDEYSDQVVDNAAKADDPEDKQDKKKQKSDSGEGEKKDHLKRLQETTEARLKDQKAAQKAESQDQAHDKTQDEGMTHEQLVDELELGSLELEPTHDRNALLERAMRVVLRLALDPTQRGSEIQERLNQLASMTRRFRSPSLKALYVQALSAHASEHPGIKDWVDHLVRVMPEQDLNKTYQELHQIQLAVEVYSKLLDADGKIRVPHELLGTLDQVKRRINELAHPDSQDIGLVQDLLRPLPAVGRLLLRNDYDLTSVGPNQPTREVAANLKSGKVRDIRLMSILSPLADFILNSTPRPETIQVRTWERDASRPKGRDLLPLQRFSDLPRTLMGQPGLSAEENIRRGTAYVQTRRRKVEIPAGYGKEESERITIVLYDTSGSMIGNPARFQAALISAFTARALSDVSPSGKHRHREIIVPFDSTPGTPVRVTNVQEALEILRDYHSKLKNTGGGTDIQKALMQAMSLIADAEKRSGEPLAAANIILMTDGQASIDAEELLRARRAIDRKTPLQTMFIAINGTNEELMRFAMDSQSMGAERGFYREFSSDLIAALLSEADTLKLEGRNDFFTDQLASQLPREVYQLMDRALALAAKFSEEIYYGSKFIPAREHLENLEKLKWLDVKQIDRPLEKWLISVRKLALHPVFKDWKLLEAVVDDLVTNLERLTGVPSNSMSNHEQEQLRHLVRHAAGLGDGPW